MFKWLKESVQQTKLETKLETEHGSNDEDCIVINRCNWWKKRAWICLDTEDVGAIGPTKFGSIQSAGSKKNVFCDGELEKE